MNDDMELLQRWREGDLQAGDVLIRRHYAWAYTQARRRLSDDDAAAEATQHAMSVIVQKHEEITTDFRSYLRKVVYFCALSQTQGHRHRPLAEEPAPSQSQRTAASVVIGQQQVRLMIKALRTLPTDDQLLFYYDFVGDHSRTEIAQLLGLAPQHIYARVHRAKRRLRARLEAYEASSVCLSTQGGLETWLASVHRRVPDAARR